MGSADVLVNASETSVREEADGLPGVAVDGKISEDFTHDAGEFEAMTGEARGDGDLWMTRMKTDHEVLVGSEGVHAGDSAQERTVELWDEGLKMAADFGYVGVVDVAVDSLRGASSRSAVHGGFDAVCG